MRIAILLTIACLFFNIDLGFAEIPQTEQQLQGFSLSGFSDKGKKTWSVKGAFANIFSDVVYLDNITANMYGDNDNLCLVADKGRYDKLKAIIYLRDNVVATTDSGARLRTDTLELQQDRQLVKTDDKVVIDRENMVTTAKGLRAKPDLKRIWLVKNAKVDINQVKDKKSDTQTNATLDLDGLTTITCDGPLDIDYGKEIAVFNKNVFVQNKDTKMYANRMKVYFDFKNKKIINIVSEGRVKIVRDGNVSYSRKAVYSTQDQTLTLTGRPKIVIFSKDGLKGLNDASTGN